MKTTRLIAVSWLVLGTAAFAQQEQRASDEAWPERDALERLVAQAGQPAQQPPARRQGRARAEQGNRPADEQDAGVTATDMNLSGDDVDVTVIGDSLVITGNQHDIGILQLLIERLDRDVPSKDIQVVTLKERPAPEVARTLQDAVRERYQVGAKERPEDRVSITAVASNILLIVAPAPKMPEIVALATAIDTVPPALKADIMVFTIANRKATEAAERLRELIQEIRRQQGAEAGDEFTITPNDANNTIMVVGPPSEKATIQMLLDQIDAAAVPGYGELKLVVFPLVNSQAEDLAKMFEDMLAASEAREGMQEQIRRLIMLKRGADGDMRELPPINLEKTLRLVPHEDTNSVLVATVEENIGPVGEVISLLDTVPISVEMGVRVFPLRFADAETVSETLEEMFEEGRDLPKAAEGGQDVDGAVPTTTEGEALVYNVGVVADTRTNTVFATGRPMQLALMDRVVAEMDRPARALRFPLRLLFLGDNVDATRVSQIVESLWEKRLETLEAQDAGKAAIERERVFLAVDLRSNALIVSASEDNYSEITEICSKLDTAPDRLIDQIRIINCRNTSAGDLQIKIEELWKRKADLRAESEVLEDLPIIVADQRSNALVIASSPEDFAEIKRLVDRLEAQPLAPIAAIRLITLTNNDASEISQILEDLFQERLEQRLAKGQEENPSDRVALAFDAPTNTILVASSQENYDEMLSIVSVLDVEPDTEGVVRSFVLANAEATNVSERIKDLFDQGLYNPSTGLDSQLTEERMKIAIVADARANAIIVSASKPNMSIVERLVEQMDSPETPLRENTQLFQLRFADAVKLTDMLERLFEGMKQSAADPDIFTEPTIIPDDRSNVLIVSGTRDAMKRCQDLIAQLDREAGPPTSVFEVYPLAHTSAVKLAPIMQEMFEKRSEGVSDERTPINLFADEGSNALIASAAREDQMLVRHLLGILDKPSTISRQFRIFPLSRAKADPLADTLDELFQSRAEGAGSDARADAIAVQPDPRTNSLIVWASPTEMDNIATIIGRLDTTDPTRKMAVRVIQLKQARAEDLAEVLDETLIGEAGGEGDDSQAVIITYMGLTEDGLREERKLVRQDLTITPEERTNTLTVMAPADSIDMLEALIRDFDKIRPILAEVRLFPLVNADAEEVVERMQELFEEAESGDVEQTLTLGSGGAVTLGTSGEGSVRQQMRFTADHRTNTVIAAGSEVDLRMVEQLIYHLDAFDAEERMLVVYEAKNSTSEALTQAIRDYAQAEDDRLSDLEDETAARRQAERQITAIGDDQSNSVVLGVSRRYYDQYMTMIQELDRPSPQVMIQVLIAEVTLDDSVDLGIEFAAQDLLFTEHAVVGPNDTVLGADFDYVVGTDLGAAGTGGGFNFTITGEDFAFLLRALQADSRLEVLSRPTLLVENNESANITIGDRVPIVQGSTFTDAGNTSTQVTYENVGIILDVTPHINPDGYVNLEIKPEISQISDSSVQLTEGLTAPVFSERSAETVVTVQDGETVVIGGLITESDRESETKVPVVGDIPGLGLLFRNTGRTARKTELLMVLTVNVLRTEEDLRAMSVKERDRSGLLGNISRNPLMEGLRIRAEDDELSPLAPDETPAEQQPPRQDQGRERRRDLYGPTPDVYGPPGPPTRAQKATKAARPVAQAARSHGPPPPGHAGSRYGTPRPSSTSRWAADRHRVQLVSMAPQSP